jgi:ERCC4-related helicase
MQPNVFSIGDLGHLNLLVPNRIKAEDATRQTRTAQEIIRRFEKQPGLILADEVGMGKTFVALAAAASAHFNDPNRNPVVVMVPPALSQKWPTDADVFREKCLRGPWKEQFRFNEEPITSGIDLLKTLDDAAEKRNSVVFITHGALYRSLSDSWVKLAILRRSLHGKHNVDDIRVALSRFAGDLLRMKRSVPDEAWAGLLERDPVDWLGYLKRDFPESVPEDKDDPVPAHLWEAIQDPALRPALDRIRNLLETMPRRESKYLGSNITSLRQQLRDEIDALWKQVKGRMKIKLPLLIFDEAHHLKNPETQLVKSLFRSGSDDAESVNGAFHGVFSKMLFLTATPFQLGHYELISVLKHFESVAWMTSEDKSSYAHALEVLKMVLDAAQEGALRLDQAWSRLRAEDLLVGGQPGLNEEEWWSKAMVAEAVLTERGQAALRQSHATETKMREAEALLRPWVLRHLKPRQLVQNGSSIPRREALPGKGIVDPKAVEQGLDVQGLATLPFLLAARTVAITPSGRAVYAEGLASSYEAFLNTHKNRQSGLDEDEEKGASEEDPQTRWYVDAIHTALTKRNGDQVLPGHPKVEATAQKVLSLWERGEKVVVFCHYIETGRALRLAISKAIEDRILDLAGQKMPGVFRDGVAERLEGFGEKFFDSDGGARLYFDKVAGGIVDQYKILSSVPQTRERLVDVMRRFVRTPAYLARFFPLDRDLGPAEIDEAFTSTDASGLSLREVFEGFLEFLGRCQKREREEYLEAVDRVQTGSHRVAASRQLAGEDGDRREGALPNVRLVNGTTKADARRKLMLTFNTPFYPEVLIASAVLAEGVDLHLNCRYVIHHDLCWNPSTLEQRTGRVDRIGAKAEKCHRSIEVYLPYVGGTQDEKMYRVVMDRERWFKVVMGEEMKTDIGTVERIAARIPLPLSLAERLAFKLEV